MDGGRKADRDTELVLLLAEVTATESVLAAGSVVPGRQDLHAHALRSTGRRSYRKERTGCRRSDSLGVRVAVWSWLNHSVSVSAPSSTEIKQRSS